MIKKILLFIFIIISLYVSLNYIGNKIIYYFFCATSLFFLFYMFRKKSIFFDHFIGLFLFLGLWFNFSLKIKLKNLFPEGFGDFKYWFSDGVGSFNFSSESLDKVLIICIISYLAISLSSFLREKIFFYKENKISNFEKKFYTKRRKTILISFAILILILSLINFSFKIYQRGNINDLGFIINASFTFIFFILLPSITAIIINYEFHTSKSLLITIIISIYESFLNSFSILSRNFIFNPLSNILGLYKLNKSNKKFDIKIFNIFFVSIMIFFMISVVLVSKQRNEFVIKDFQEETSNLNSSQKQNNKFIQNSSERLLKIFISRLIGVEGIMAVSSRNNLSFNLFFSALNEKFIRGENSFYDKFKNEERTTAKCSNKNGLKNDCKINSISLMGIIAFLFYTGSYFFLFFALNVICLICSLLEILAYKISNNMVFASFIAQVLAYRLWHFGYIPSSSYKLLLSICFIIFLIYLYRKLLSKNQI